MADQRPRALLPNEAVVGDCTDMLPTVAGIAKIFASAAARKACGEDGIPADLFRALPAVFAKIYHPLFLKSVAYSYEPFLWRGGLIHQIWKAKDDPAECDAHRAV
eukprot:9241746-Alexandrium_andersonii.AAC.1